MLPCGKGRQIECEIDRCCGSADAPLWGVRFVTTLVVLAG